MRIVNKHMGAWCYHEPLNLIAQLFACADQAVGAKEGRCVAGDLDPIAVGPPSRTIE